MDGAPGVGEYTRWVCPPNLMGMGPPVPSKGPAARRGASGAGRAMWRCLLVEELSHVPEGPSWYSHGGGAVPSATGTLADFPYGRCATSGKGSAGLYHKDRVRPPGGLGRWHQERERPGPTLE